MPKLILKTGEKSGMEYEVRDGLVLGRRLEAPIHVNDVKASREHAKVSLEGGGYVLVDLDSTNGTFVNGSKITRHRLVHDDLIRIGRTMFVYHDPASAPPGSGGEEKIELGMNSPPPRKIDLDVPPPKKMPGPLKPGKSRRDRHR
jgi:pSer/pThr/pTyr-binding forkhead associated (FHA) protein